MTKEVHISERRPFLKLGGTRMHPEVSYEDGPAASYVHPLDLTDAEADEVVGAVVRALAGAR